MGKLTDILGDGGFDDINNRWNLTGAAGDFGPLPPGEYITHIASGELESSRNRGTPGYKLTHRVVKGPGESLDYVDRLFWDDIWLTPAALPMAKRDLAKLGVTSLEQLEQPLPLGIRCRVQLALRKGDDGSEFNSAVRFDVLGIDTPEADPFAPDDAESDDDLDDSFEFGKGSKTDDDSDDAKGGDDV
ncbi:hypothetical protein [Adhaeretor mobilis]|uniref:Uncharacterized protein n=1 Tax=Adhaeretor mobilis TaxID=1930276 RepID=A0A517MTD4_9BACT|nr:hypothetical protein [Adhaeretor mobilis]QDS98145.1 hypothetical protein HG15A2_14180 [Adhaeretor mobilis]